MAEENPYAAPEADVAVEVAPQDAELASRWARLGGSIIDGILILVVLFPVAYFGGLYDTANPTESTLAEDVMIGLLGFVVFLAFNAYLLARSGQTIGKLVVGTRIVSAADGRLAPAGKVIGLRYLAFWILAQVPVVGQIVAGLVDPLLVFRADKRCLHDLVAGTKVVKA